MNLSFLIDTMDKSNAIDTDLLRDLDAHIGQAEQQGGQVMGNIETAAARMQGVKLLMETINQLEAEKRELLRRRDTAQKPMIEAVQKQELELENVRGELERLQNATKVEVQRVITDSKQRQHTHANHYYEWMDKDGSLQISSESTSSCRMFCEDRFAETFISNNGQQLTERLDGLSQQIDKKRVEITDFDRRLKILYSSLQDKTKKSSVNVIIADANSFRLDEIPRESIILKTFAQKNVCYAYNEYGAGLYRLENDFLFIVLSDKIICFGSHMNNMAYGKIYEEIQRLEMQKKSVQTGIDELCKEIEKIQLQMQLFNSRKKVDIKHSYIDEYATHTSEGHYYEWEENGKGKIVTPCSITKCNHTAQTCINADAEADRGEKIKILEITMRSLALQLDVKRSEQRHQDAMPTSDMDALETQIQSCRQQLNLLLGIPSPSSNGTE